MRDIVVLAHPGRPAATQAAAELVSCLHERGLHPVVFRDRGGPGILRELGDRSLDLDMATTLTDVPAAELVVVLGGDGTILRAAEIVHDTDIPLLGVNLGHVGFLAEAEPEEIDSTVARIADRDYHVERRMTLAMRITHPDSDEVVTGWAVNDATLEKVDRAKMIEVAVGVDGRGLSTFGCDGVVTATPTGSTAHAFSAGGPVVWPDVEAMLVVPLAAHALFARPLVLSPESSVSLDLLDRTASPGVVTCDGQRMIDVRGGSRLEISRGERPLQLARLNAAPFTDRLVGKFSLPVSGWRGRGETEGNHA